MNALTLSYIITGILVLTGIKTFVIAGIFFGVCYLPGLVLITLLKKNALELEDVILAFPGSVGISSLLTLGLLYMGINVRFIAYVIYGITGLVLLVYLIRHRSPLPFNIDLSPEEVRFIGTAFLVTLMFSIPVISERIAVSHHGFHHLSLVTTIFNGFFPPENPGMGGTAIGYHWGYHALVAAISFPSNLHPLRVFSVLNMLSLFFIFCVSYRVAKSMGFSNGFSYFVPLALIGMMRSDAILFFLQKVVLGNFPIVEFSDTAPLNTLAGWTWGVSYLDTRLFFMNKFYNANNMPLGLSLIFSFFMVLLPSDGEKAKTDNVNIKIIFLALLLIAIAVTYAFFLIIPLFFVPVWGILLFFTNRASHKERYKEVLRLVVPCLIAAVITGPYLMAIMKGSSVVTAGQSMDSFKFFYINEQSIKNLIIFMTPLPFIIAGLYAAYRQLAFSRSFLFLVSGSVLFLLLSIFLQLNWGNSVKFSYILSFFFSFFFVFAIAQIYSFLPNMKLKKVMSGFIILFLSSTPFLTEAAYICSPWFKDRTYAFSEKHVFFGKDKSRNGAYTWIRENTPPDALLLLPYFKTPFAPGGITIAQTFSYRPAALTERSLFVVKDVYAYLLPEYEKRVQIREQFFRNPADPEVKRYFTLLDRPIYLLIEKDLDDPIMKGVEVEQTPEGSDKELLLVYKNDKQMVYKINN